VAVKLLGVLKVLSMVLVVEEAKEAGLSN